VHLNPLEGLLQMTLSKKPYRGTRDFFPQEKRLQNYLFDHMKKTAESFGYEPYDGPLLEEVELYKAKSGEELINDQIYSFTDRGERFVAIRPEMTPTLARLVAQVHREESKPIRWYSIPNLMRYEKPQKGRLREHWQFNCDIFGAPGRSGEVEILQVAINLLESYGANQEHFEILINDRTIVDTIFSKLIKANEEETYALYKIVDKAKKVPQEALVKMFNEKTELTEDSQKIFFEYLSLESFDALITFLNQYDSKDVANEFSQLIDQLKELNLIQYCLYDPTIVRGLDYYTGIVFEIFDKSPENRRALCGGGAYANLLQIFNEPSLPGVGFGLGDVTLKDFLTSHNLVNSFEKPENDLLFTFQTESARKQAIKMANALRKSNLKVISTLEPLKFKKVFPTASKKGARFVALLGDNELSENKVSIKNLETKEQVDFSLEPNDLVKILEFING
jgi:histidyl-tRNA synthetase